jgi:two-component system cell cycle sensor histidine kinase/response regulator CckA
MNISPRKQFMPSAFESPDGYRPSGLLLITDRMPWWLAYVFAVAVTLGMLYLRMIMAVSFGQRPLLILFVLPILLSSMIGGFGPGLIATAIASLGVNYFGLPPVNSLRIKASHDIFQWLMLIASGILCSYLSELLHRARRLSEERRIQQEAVQENLSKSMERYRILVENSLQGIAILKGIPPVIVYVNPRWTEVYGYTADEILSFDSEKIWNLVHPEDRVVVRQRNLDRLMGKSTTSIYAFRIIRKDGETRWVEVFANKIPSDNDTSMIIATCIDITERKQAEEAFQHASNYNRSLIEASLDPLVTIGSDGKITDVNKATEIATDYRREELIGTDFADYFTEPELARSGYRRVFQEGHVSDYALNMKRRDGTEIPVLYNSSVYRDMNGVVIGVFAAARDITKRNQAEKARLYLEMKLQQLRKAESLGRMAGAIAHHFNNQLYVVMGNIEMAIDGLPSNSDTFRFLAEAMKASGKAAQISSLMLTYLGQTSGKMETLDLSESCRQSLSLLQATLPQGITFHAELPAVGPFIRSNAGQIQKILTNLMTNASEAVGENAGTIDLTVRSIALENIPVATRFPVDWHPKESIYACLEVADTGCGIADADIEKIFDPFYTTKFTGRGLGLPTVLGMVSAHSGGLTVESRAGCGSVFRIFLPVSAEAIPVSPEKSGELSEIKGTGTILVVDDDPLVRNMAKSMLIRLGYSVLEAKDGVEAVEVFQQHHPAIRCVLSDLSMPRMNGWDTLAALRNLSPNIPVILSSGYDEAQVMAEEHPERPNAFLGKPYQIKGLGEIVNRVLASVDH